MKKYIFYIIGLVSIDILVTLIISTQMLTVQQNYQHLRQVEKDLQSENNRLSREVAHLSSLNKISQTAEDLGLTKTGTRIVYVKKDVFAALK